MTDFIGYTAGTLAMLTFIPQIIKTIRTKKTADISIPMLLLVITANVLYIVYGFMLRLYPVIIMVGLMTFTVLLQLVLTIKYKRGPWGNQASHSGNPR